MMYITMRSFRAFWMLTVAVICTACSKAPGCGEPQTAALLKETILNEMAGPFRINEEKLKTNIDVADLLATNYNESIDRHSCKGNLMMGGRGVLAFTYESQLDSSGTQVISLGREIATVANTIAMRAMVTQGLDFIAEAKEAYVAHRGNSGFFPQSDAEAAFTPPSAFPNSAVESVHIAPDGIVVTFDKLRIGRDAKLRLIGYDDGSQVTWRCVGANIKPEWLPEACRQ